jgi:hypothetical protein
MVWPQRGGGHTGLGFRVYDERKTLTSDGRDGHDARDGRDARDARVFPDGVLAT